MNLKIYCDGGARGNPGPAAAAFVVYDERDKKIYSQARFLGVATNNFAEYRAVLSALEWVAKNSNVIFVLDSELVVKQLTGIYKIKSEKLKELVIKIKRLEKEKNLIVSYGHVPRNKNKEADLLVNQTLDSST